LQSSNENKKITIFDLDGTLAYGNVSFAFGRFLRKKGFLPIWKALLLSFIYCLQKIHLVSLSSLHRASFYLLFYQVPKKVAADLAHEFVEIEGTQLLRTELLKEIDHAKKHGELVLLASSSPEFLVRPVAKLAGIDHVLATNYEIDKKNSYTKISLVVDGEEKKSYSKKYPHAYVTAYSDSILDLPLLQSVQVAIAVCPDRQLKKIALKNGWKIME
jgi:HAD superfamily phosphoserine phosphatase-like hydrolase